MKIISTANRSQFHVAGNDFHGDRRITQCCAIGIGYVEDQGLREFHAGVRRLVVAFQNRQTGQLSIKKI